jgi:hypothetical protein
VTSVDRQPVNRQDETHGSCIQHGCQLRDCSRAHLAAVARVRDLEAARDLLARIRQWDALNPPIDAPYGDATYWVAEIDRVLAALAPAENQPEGDET